MLPSQRGGTFICGTALWHGRSLQLPHRDHSAAWKMYRSSSSLLARLLEPRCRGINVLISGVAVESKTSNHDRSASSEQNCRAWLPGKPTSWDPSAVAPIFDMSSAALHRDALWILRDGDHLPNAAALPLSGGQRAPPPKAQAGDHIHSRRYVGLSFSRMHFLEVSTALLGAC